MFPGIQKQQNISYSHISSLENNSRLEEETNTFLLTLFCSFLLIVVAAGSVDGVSEWYGLRMF